MTSTNVYEQIGRRAVEILSTASFAIQPPGSEKKLKKKSCKKGLSCNFTCIAANKTCRVGMTLEQQRAAAEIRKAARAGKKEASKAATGALGEGGGLVAVPKPKQDAQDEPQPKAVKRSQVDEINEKFANADPTDKDAQDYIDARLKAFFEPTERGIDERTARSLAEDIMNNQFGLLPDSITEAMINRAIDRESLGSAVHAVEQWQKANQPDLVAMRTSSKHWLDSITARFDGLKIEELPTYKKNLEDAKSATAKKKWEKIVRSIESDIANMPEHQARAERLANKWKARYNATKDERIKEIGADFDQEKSKVEKQMKKDWMAVGKGKDKDSYTVQALSEISSFDMDEMRVKSPDISEVKAHLRTLHGEKIGGSSLRDAVTKKELRKAYREQAAILHPDNKETGDAAAFRALTDQYSKKMELMLDV